MASLKIRVDSGSVLCGTVGGNADLKGGQRVEWVSDHPFTLEFFRTPYEADEQCDPRDEQCDPVKLDGWPFSDPERARDVSWPVKSFAGVLKPGFALFKYSITVGNLRLDPIIIVDRFKHP